MSKKRIFAILTFIVGCTLIVTNPSVEQHQFAVRDKAKEILIRQLNYEDKNAIELGMSLFGDKLINRFMEANVKTKNYYFFSLTTINWQGEDSVIGVGILRKVWLSNKIDSKVDEVISTLKKIGL